jgi:hypothetical protein
MTRISRGERTLLLWASMKGSEGREWTCSFGSNPADQVPGRLPPNRADRDVSESGLQSGVPVELTND